MAGVPVMLVTANVGSIFEEPNVMLRVWTEEFLSTISRLDPKFIALHCQEVGGKNYEESMKHVEDFVRLLINSEELRLFDKVRVYLDEDYSSPENFTALGNLYFVHDSLKDVLLWDFQESEFLPVTGKELYVGNIESVPTKEKSKFPQDFFPECKWSRKGFLRTRWSISGTIFDLINIHLFHDASNLIAMETFPSVYSKTRRRALEHTLQRFHNDQYPNAPYFVFGDFNFRTDTAGVIKKLTENTEESQTSAKGSISKLQFRNKQDDLILTLGKKEFVHHQHQNVFIENGGQWLREYDRELEDFGERLFEFPIIFVPSYPFEEDINEGTNYMQTRVPAWCDRVLLSPSAKSLVKNIQSNEVEYGIMGPSKCMGDHKPVYLRVLLASDAGMINCCNLSKPPDFCFRVPDNYSELLSMLPDSRSCARTHAANRPSNLLPAPELHDPYTPDSMESPSPNTTVIVGDTPNLDLESGTSELAEANSRFFKKIDRAVSPSVLKSKLELVAKYKREGSLDAEQEVEIKGIPSECLDMDNCQMEMGRNRSNSDISWKRIKIIQREASVRGKSEHSLQFLGDNFSQYNTDDFKKISGDHSASRNIPLIEITNASNVQSNASSVHLHDDHLSTYSESRTKTVSIEGSLQETSEDTCSKEEDILDFRLNIDESQISKSEINMSQIDESNLIEESFYDESLDIANTLPEGETSERGKGLRPKKLEKACDRNVIEENPNRNASIEIEVLNTSRSNSTESQDSADNSGKVKFKKKAYSKVTERCKRNIVREKGQCRKCCCVIT